ncbi:type II secretion system F family protein [Pseudarthrobacter sp. NS4]|uniref:type II secretion system F family protein n=1 Tax=Pseudarthrobacter sp. NS4 TaxID=2973976 RepID=UPI002161B592|nr:type II secretion system F family protein [Pseudarthrobacter sp. NS4]
MTENQVLAFAVFLALAAAVCLGCAGRGAVRNRLHNLPLGVRNDADRVGDEAAITRKRGGPGLKDTAMMLELVAAMLDAGSSIGRSLELVAASASDRYSDSLRPVVSALAIGADWDTAWRSSAVRLPEILELRDALGFAALTGAPSSAILYAQAARLRRERFRAAEKRAASLGVKLVVPLGLCSLPAFICLGVVPVLLALVPSGS